MVVEPINECFSEVIKRIENKIWPNYFKPRPPWFPGHDERCVEIPWALSRYQGQKKILEIGLSLADLTLVKAQMRLKELTGCELYGLDIVDINRVLSRFEPLSCDIKEAYDFHQADARNTGFADNSFDLIFLISTLEHFGFDDFEPDKDADTVFKRPREYPSQIPVYGNCQEDRKALAEIGRILTPRGSLLLTLPLGGRGICVLKDSKGLWAFYKEYTSREWKALLDDSGLQVIEERFFRDCGENGWVQDKNPEELMKMDIELSDPVRGVACAELSKG